MKIQIDNKVESAKYLIDGYIEKSILIDFKESSNKRYLWTDAFAVHCMFALSRIYQDEYYKNIALKFNRQCSSCFRTL